MPDPPYPSAWRRPDVSDVILFVPEGSAERPRRAAIVAHVHDEGQSGCINLAWFDSNGQAQTATSIQHASVAPSGMPFWEWRPSV